jgi:hypothetical protein
MAQKGRTKSRKTTKTRVKSLSVRKADRVKGGMTPGPEDLNLK